MDRSRIADERQCQEVDLFRESFKRYKSKQASLHNKQSKQAKKSEPDDVINISNLDIMEHLNEKVVLQRSISFDGRCDCSCHFGLKPPNTWEVYDFTFPAGLIFIKNPFTRAGQRYWMKRAVLDLPKVPNISNIDNLERKEGITIKDKMSDEEFYRKLRWVTFGYHHDWDTKVYSESRKNEFPEDLASLTKFISQVLSFTDFKAEAAIANYYHLDSTLSGHVDKSEANMTAPLFSLSFGQTAIFLIGGSTKAIKPVPILLQSGDIVVMAGESRLSYHGVPKILKSSNDSWDCDLDGNEGVLNEVPEAKRIKLGTCELHSGCEWSSSILADAVNTAEWNSFLANYASTSRINLNIRQVLFPEQTELPDSSLIKS